MAVQFLKPKVQDVEKLDSTEVVTPEVVDAYAVKKRKLEGKLAKISPLQKEVDTMEKAILGCVDEVVDPSQKFTLRGLKFELALGAQGQRTELINAELANDLLGDELFLKLAKVSMTDLKAYLTPDQLAEVTATSYKIKRRIKVEDL